MSFDDAVKELKVRISARDAFLSVAGSWNMSDAEAAAFEKENRTLWKTWKMPSA